jgi:hypothetical protein
MAWDEGFKSLMVGVELSRSISPEGLYEFDNCLTMPQRCGELTSTPLGNNTRTIHVAQNG